MKKLIYLFILLPAVMQAQPFSKTEIARWQKQAQQVTIIRDNWGIPHVYGKTDADAVFGLLYAQCEDDFSRVEMNYVEKLGRLAEVNGSKDIYNDLYVRLLIDSTDAIADYRRAPLWLKRLCLAYADGINYFLYKHPTVKPALLQRFQPWFPLLWTDGSIGAISTGGVSTQEMKNFYSGDKSNAWVPPAKFEEAVTGSNGFAIAPSHTKNGNAILYINPHVTFYFRPEVHMVSEEGLNAYGAVTWGQFFVYQGFNEYCGWMHTSSQADVADLYAEKVTDGKNGLQYEYDGAKRKIRPQQMRIRYATDSGTRAQNFTALYTHHGPVMAERDSHYISVKASNRMMNSLIQSWQRTKAKGLDDYLVANEWRGNTSNNTVFADNKGHIAYWHGNFMPVRDTQFNWSRPVDGSTSKTEWNGLHDVKELVQVVDPASGWIQNCNSTPFTASGGSSPQRKNYPYYMAPDGENFRGINAVRVLSKENKFTIEKIIDAGYDTYLAAFEKLVPALVTAFEKNYDATDPQHAKLAEAVMILKNWDMRCGEASVATTLAVEWGQRLLPMITKTAPVDDEEATDQVSMTNRFAATAAPAELVETLRSTLAYLENSYGKWQVAWGDINRFQRIASENIFDDSKPSYPVAFASSLWGMLPSYTSRNFPGNKNRYGVNGNSFICAVEFGKKVKAKSLLAGGESGHPASPHFFDQGNMYSKGIFKDVLFYKEDVKKHVEKEYHPGE